MPKRPGLSIRPGLVRAARTEAGLTLQELAAGHLTKQALSLVEKGKARPSLSTLRLIAERTGKRIDHFLAEPLPPEPVSLELESDLAELERLAAQEEYAAVVELGEPMLLSPLPASIRARIQLRLGKAYVKLFRAEFALKHLTPARESFRVVGDGWSEVECLNYEACALDLREDPRALTVGGEALRRCRELDPVPLQTELRVLVNLATFHGRQHDWRAAVGLCQEAIVRADQVHDLGRMARLQHSLAVAYRNLGETGRALVCAQKALALQEFERDGAQKARVENTLGLLLLQQGDLEGAERSMRQSLQSYDATRRESGKSHVLMSLAELHLARNQPVDAEKMLQQAIAGFEARNERMSLALGKQLMGQALAGQGRASEADRSFEEALKLLQQLNVTERLVECHAAYAAALEARGETKRALKHWKLGLLSQRPELDRGLPAAATVAKTG